MNWQVTHQPCINPDCGSSDGMSIDEDGRGYCFVCEKSFSKEQLGYEEPVKSEKKEIPATEIEKIHAKGKYKSIQDRGITKETAEKYKVVQWKDAHGYPYYNKDGSMIGIKKRVVSTKDFIWGGTSKKTQLFGQQLFSSGGKKITICEGELDALAAYQMMGSKYPVVSIPAGATGSMKHIKENFEWLNSFEEIIISFDSDEPGQRGAQAIAQEFPKKAKIMKMDERYKDACGYLKAHKSKEFIDAFWRADTFKPDDIKSVDEYWESILNYHESRPMTPTPWQGLNDVIGGYLPGQLVTIGAGTGSGKSTIMRAMMRDLINYLQEKDGDRVAAFFLEEGGDTTALRLLGMEVGKELQRPEVFAEAFKDEESRKQIKEMFDRFNNKIDVYDGFNFDDIDDLLAKILYLVKARGVKYVILDHLTMLVDSDSNARVALNRLVEGLKGLAKEQKIIIISACHLRKASGTSHEEGGRVTLDDFKESKSVTQLSDIVVGLERNSQSDNSAVRGLTMLRVLKSRDLGDTGVACGLQYDSKTMRYKEIDADLALDIFKNPPEIGDTSWADE